MSFLSDLTKDPNSQYVLISVGSVITICCCINIFKKCYKRLCYNCFQHNRYNMDRKLQEHDEYKVEELIEEVVPDIIEEVNVEEIEDIDPKKSPVVQLVVPVINTKKIETREFSVVFKTLMP